MRKMQLKHEMPFHLVSHQHNELYTEVILSLANAKKSVLIATANVKDVQIKKLKRYFSIIDTFAKLVQRGVDIKILHARKPSGPFLESIGKHRELEQEHFDMRMCSRNHMKMISIDNETMYMGSANLTGAGIGLRSAEKHNFELGIVTHDKDQIKQAADIFYDIWSGYNCKKCAFKKRGCTLPLEKIL